MFHSLREIRRHRVLATDGEIGGIHDVFFDDRDWVVRYFVVDTGGWLAGRQVLVSPVAISHIERDARNVHVMLTRRQVEQSPDVQTHLPVSRQYETEIASYYAWPVYWGPGGLGMPTWAGAAPPPMPLEEPRGSAPQSSHQDPNLRSAREVTGYYIEARDGGIGHVEDFIADDEDWTIRYLELDTRNWLPGKKVLLPPQWVSAVDWENSRVHVDLLRDVIRQSPEYDATAPITREYERRLFDHYGRPRYWEQYAEVRHIDNP